MKKLYTLLFVFLFSVSVNVADANTYWNNDLGTVKITRFYPNPASSFINFEFQRLLEKGCVLQLYNAIGKKVSEIAVTGNKLTISLDNYYRGIYFFLLCDKNGRIIDSAKFQVVK
jgi:hypothetical protein